MLTGQTAIQVKSAIFQRGGGENCELRNQASGPSIRGARVDHRSAA